mmetsp:Transcript_43443/g.138278  ORF Transcript_43443/g.138278 Transcript_43443/m.138278 type:complete len:114 (+) Transcript_43443:77-418(+)
MASMSSVVYLAACGVVGLLHLVSFGDLVSAKHQECRTTSVAVGLWYLGAVVALARAHTLHSAAAVRGAAWAPLVYHYACGLSLHPLHLLQAAAWTALYRTAGQHHEPEAGKGT